MHVFIQGVHVFNILNPIEIEGGISGEVEIVNKGRFNQKLGYLTEGNKVHVLAGGREAFIVSEPTDGRIQLTLRFPDG